MQFRGKVLKNGVEVLKNVTGEIRLGESGDKWTGSFAVPVGRVIQTGHDYTLVDEKGGAIDIRITSLTYGKERTALFEATSGWR